MRSGKKKNELTRVVLDTNVLVSAFFWDGNEREVQRRCCSKDLQSVTSPDILNELDHVLGLKFGLPDSAKRMYLRKITMVSEMVYPKGGLRIVKEHPSDDIVLETALIGKADFIVTGDRHLLRLKCYVGIEILRAADL